MKYPVMTIAADGTAPSKRNRHRKTHGFSCTLLRAVLWPAYKPAGNKTIMRPVFMDFCGTESEHRAFVANLRCGRAARVSDREAYEFLKSEPYAYAPPQRCAAGVRQIVYYPELFDLEVKAQRDELWVCAMPPTKLLATVSDEESSAVSGVLRSTNERIAAERTKIETENVVIERERAEYYSVDWRARSERNLRYRDLLRLPELIEMDDEALRYWALIARELCVRLDARTRYPVPYAPEFRALLVRELLAKKHLTLSEGCPLSALEERSGWGRENKQLDVRGPMVNYRDLADVGYLPPVGLRIKQEELGTLLADLAREYYK